jgi:hypothetical protein
MDLPVGSFQRRSVSSDGLEFRCRTCLGEYNRGHRAGMSPEKIEKRRASQRVAMNARYKIDDSIRDRMWRRSIERRYQIDETKYVALLERQGGSCAVCLSVDSGRRLAVDHCHVTGVVRGLLCSKCNTAIGMLGDNEEGIERALAYLQRNTSGGTDE